MKKIIWQKLFLQKNIKIYASLGIGIVAGGATQIINELLVLMTSTQKILAKTQLPTWFNLQLMCLSGMEFLVR